MILAVRFLPRPHRTENNFEGNTGRSTSQHHQLSTNEARRHDFWTLSALGTLASAEIVDMTVSYPSI